MGISISYRGRFPDPSRIEDFEDRLVDCALVMGAQVQIWRSQADDDPDRMVRGVILTLAPGQEPTSLLVSPEGWLIGLIDIQDAEEGKLREPPWCSVKTQFGSIEGHVALVEMLAVLKREFLPELEVSDDGGYWETRDLTDLVRKHTRTQAAIDGLAQGLLRSGLSPEAAEDPTIVLRRIERVAELVQRTLRRPAEHPPVELDHEESCGVPADPAALERVWDQLAKQNRRHQERILRRLAEGQRRGLDETSAFTDAIRDVIPDSPDDETERSDEPWRDDAPPASEELSSDGDAGFEGATDDPFVTEDPEDPLLRTATDLFERCLSVCRGVDRRSAPALDTLYQGLGDVMGGLAQALSDPDRDAVNQGLRIVQLKRALRGAAFARGALFPLRSTIGPVPFDDFLGTLEQLETDIVSELGKARSEDAGDDT